MMVDEMISAGHARALLAIEMQRNNILAMKIFDEKLSVRETEKLVKTILNPSKKKEKKAVSALKMRSMKAWKKK